MSTAKLSEERGEIDLGIKQKQSDRKGDETVFDFIVNYCI